MSSQPTYRMLEDTYAYGAIGDWLYRKVAGLELHEDVPAFKQFTVRPYVGEGFDWVKATYESMYGKIKSAWRKNESGRLELEVIVPPNTTACVELLGAKVEEVKEGNIALSQVKDLLAYSESSDGVNILIGSGQYRFTY